MGIAEDIQKSLDSFEKNTEGILGSSVIVSSNALVLAEASSSFDRNLVQGMSAKIMELGEEVLTRLLGDNHSLRAITIVEAEHFIYVRPINKDYYVVVITNSQETAGLRELNVKTLIKQLQKLLGS